MLRLYQMKSVVKQRNPRKRRALAVLAKAPGLNAIPAKSMPLVSFRAPNAAERARGKAFSGRAARLLAGKVATA